MLFSVNKIENKIYELSIYKKSLKISKGVIRIPKSKDGQHMYNACMARRKTIKGHTREKFAHARAGQSSFQKGY